MTVRPEAHATAVCSIIAHCPTGAVNGVAIGPGLIQHSRKRGGGGGDGGGGLGGGGGGGDGGGGGGDGGGGLGGGGLGGTTNVHGS